MSKAKLKEYKTNIAAALRETTQAIKEAIELINNHEDGPATMRAALREIEAFVSNVETEISCMEYGYEDIVVMMARVSQQRDEAFRQRDIMARQLRIEQEQNRDFKRFC